MSWCYLIDVFHCVISHLITANTRVISTLPRYQNGERLDILNRKFQDERRGTESVRVQLEEHQSL